MGHLAIYTMAMLNNRRVYLCIYIIDSKCIHAKVAGQNKWSLNYIGRINCTRKFLTFKRRASTNPGFSIAILSQLSMCLYRILSTLYAVFRLTICRCLCSDFVRAIYAATHLLLGKILNVRRLWVKDWDIFTLKQTFPNCSQLQQYNCHNYFAAAQ